MCCKRRGFGQEVRHHLNSMTICCFLLRLTGNRGFSKRIAGVWETTPFYKVLYLAEVRMKRGGKKNESQRR